MTGPGTLDWLRYVERLVEMYRRAHRRPVDAPTVPTVRVPLAEIAGKKGTP